MTWTWATVKVVLPLENSFMSLWTIWSGVKSETLAPALSISMPYFSTSTPAMLANFSAASRSAGVQVGERKRTVSEMTADKSRPAMSLGMSTLDCSYKPVTMVAVQVMGNDAAVGFAASQGNFELNVFMPVIAYNFLQSANLLADSITSFEKNCARGIKANKEKMHHNLYNSLMLVTALNPYIGYENAAKTAKKAYKENISLKEACVSLGFLTAEKFDEVFRPEDMACLNK